MRVLAAPIPRDAARALGKSQKADARVEKSWGGSRVGPGEDGGWTGPSGDSVESRRRLARSVADPEDDARRSTSSFLDASGGDRAEVTARLPRQLLCVAPLPVASRARPAMAVRRPCRRASPVAGIPAASRLKGWRGSTSFARGWWWRRALRWRVASRSETAARRRRERRRRHRRRPTRGSCGGAGPSRRPMAAAARVVVVSGDVETDAGGGVVDGRRRGAAAASASGNAEGRRRSPRRRRRLSPPRA